MTGTTVAPCVVRNSSGIVVGQFSIDGFLEKRGIDFQRHHLHKYHGWATDSAHVAMIEERRGPGMRLLLIDGRTLESRLADWLHHGYTSPHLEGDQTVLPDRYWRDPSAPAAPPMPPRPPMVPPVQLQIAMAL